jgi:hypothetical protein
MSTDHPITDEIYRKAVAIGRPAGGRLGADFVDKVLVRRDRREFAESHSPSGY